MGESMAVLVSALSSSDRPKIQGRGHEPGSAAVGVHAFDRNEVRLLLSLMAYQVMQIPRRTMARATGTCWSLRPQREQVLWAGARLTI